MIISVMWCTIQQETTVNTNPCGPPLLFLKAVECRDSELIPVLHFSSVSEIHTMVPHGRIERGMNEWIKQPDITRKSMRLHILRDGQITLWAACHV